jgi:hypothetical protein
MKKEKGKTNRDHVRRKPGVYCLLPTASCDQESRRAIPCIQPRPPVIGRSAYRAHKQRKECTRGEPALFESLCTLWAPASQITTNRRDRCNRPVGIIRFDRHSACAGRPTPRADETWVRQHDVFRLIFLWTSRTGRHRLAWWREPQDPESKDIATAPGWGRHRCSARPDNAGAARHDVAPLRGLETGEKDTLVASYFGVHATPGVRTPGCMMPPLTRLDEERD